MFGTLYKLYPLTCDHSGYKYSYTAIYTVQLCTSTVHSSESSRELRAQSTSVLGDPGAHHKCALSQRAYLRTRILLHMHIPIFAIMPPRHLHEPGLAC